MSARYMPEPIAGTSGCDHLAFEVVERLQKNGYSTKRDAERAWYSACRRVNDHRESMGWPRVTLPLCRVVPLMEVRS